jgi:hypothetical protein
MILNKNMIEREPIINNSDINQTNALAAASILTGCGLLSINLTDWPTEQAT